MAAAGSVLLSLVATCLAPRPAAVQPAAVQPEHSGPRHVRVEVAAIGDPDDPDEVLWRRLQSLRLELELPAKAVLDGGPGERAREVAAMRTVRRGLWHHLAPWRVASPTVRRPVQDPAEPAQQLGRMAEQFVAAADAHEVGARAVLALAHELSSPHAALRALQALRSERLSLPGSGAGGAAAILADLLEHELPDVRAAAWRHLMWLADAHGTELPVVDDLVRRGRERLRRSVCELVPGSWDANQRWQPGPGTVLPFAWPTATEAGEVLFAALDGDQRTLGRLGRSQLDPRLLLIAHVLAAPRVQPADARKMFSWYRRHVDGWTFAAGGLNQWEFGVIAVLVAVLPHLEERDARWCLCNLVDGHVGAAAQAVARHRLLRCGGRARAVAWLEADAALVEHGSPRDTLVAWRLFGSERGRSLDDCLLDAVLCSGAEARRALVQTTLRQAPLRALADEFATTCSLLHDPDEAVAFAALRRFARVTVDRDRDERTFDELLATAPAALAVELAIELDRPLPESVLDAAPAPLRLLHDAVRGADAAGPERLARNCSELLADAVAEHVLLRCALLATRELPGGSTDLLRRVALHTTHPEPRVRRAAYLALLARTDEPRAGLLASEAAFDRSPDVRALRDRP